METLRSSCFGSEGIHSTAKAAFHLLSAARRLIKEHQLLGVGGPPIPAGLMCSCGGLPTSSAPGQAALGSGDRAGAASRTQGRSYDRTGIPVWGQQSTVLEALRAGSFRQSSSFRGSCPLKETGGFYLTENIANVTYESVPSGEGQAGSAVQGEEIELEKKKCAQSGLIEKSGIVEYQNCGGL